MNKKLTLDQLKAQYHAELDIAVETGREAKARALRAKLVDAMTKGIGTERIEVMCNAERENRCVVLPEPEESDYYGLKVKYRVYKAKDNTPVENCFVLRPDIDPTALYALMCYGIATDNMQLGEDVLRWVKDIEAREAAEAVLATGREAN